MKYLYNGRNITIPDDFIENAMKYLNVTKERAILLFLQDTKKADADGRILNKSIK